MSNRERQQEIMAVLRQKKVVKPCDLCSMLHSSLSTVRRDLIQLEKDGQIKRSYGKISLKQLAHTEPVYQQRQRQNRQAKQQMAEIASDFIGNGQTLFLDSSTSVHLLVPFLRDKQDVVIITNGLATATQLNTETSHRVFFVGGELTPGLGAASGGLAEAFLRPFTIDVAFFSCRGIDPNFAYEANNQHAHFKQQVMDVSQQSLLLCDATKFSTRYFYKLAQLKAFSAVITNQAPVDERYLTGSEGQPEFYY